MQLAQEAELPDSVVASQHGLPSLEAADANPDVGRLDHADVVGTVPDSERDGPCSLPIVYYYYYVFKPSPIASVMAPTLSPFVSHSPVGLNNLPIVYGIRKE